MTLKYGVDTWVAIPGRKQTKGRENECPKINNMKIEERYNQKLKN